MAIVELFSGIDKIIDEAVKKVFSDLIEVGEYSSDYNESLDTNFPILPIVYGEGLKKHIAKRHPSVLHYLTDENIELILKHPDYIGQSPKEPNGIELVKRFSDNIVIAIKLDKNSNYYYIATLYDITNSKIQNRIESGRLKKIVQKS